MSVQFNSNKLVYLSDSVYVTVDDVITHVSPTDRCS